LTSFNLAKLLNPVEIYVKDKYNVYTTPFIYLWMEINLKGKTMSKELEFLFEEAKEYIKQGDIQKALNILKVLVDSGYEPAKPLYEKYKNTDDKVSHPYPSSASSNNNYHRNSYHSNQRNNRVKRDLPLFMDPSNKLWLEIILYALLVLEAIFLLFLIAQLFSGNPIVFLQGLLGLFIFHLVAMVSLNIAFNLQRVKEEVKEIKERL
jgi:hypothetical protein